MLVVVDVDNTLYDWVRLWAGAFSAMLDSLVRATGQHRDHWLNAARAVHVRRGATECPSLLCEMADAATWPQAIDASAVLPAAATVYREYWNHHLTAYPGVRESLGALAQDGHVVVAYTEGDVAIAATRIARLGLAGVIRRVFGRPPLPAARQPAWSTIGVIRHGPIGKDFIPREDSKPNPTGLRTIMAQCQSAAHTTLYVGDNLWKDVVMAQALGVSAVWARYGTARDAEHVSLLERVAHWNRHDVSREQSATLQTVTPDDVVDDPRDLSRVVARRAAAVTTA